MSEYQYYKFERLDGYLDAKARQALRAISSRAEISATSFQVYYTYSDLKAEPFELMLKYFDIGFYYADWGSIDAYIKLPAGTLPEALLCFSSDGLHIHENDEWQLLIFSLEEYDEYFDDEHADDFFQHLAALRSGLMQADRTCASGYDAASRYLHQLFEAYQFKADEAVFEQRFKRFVVANNSRKALLNRLSDLL